MDPLGVIPKMLQNVNHSKEQVCSTEMLQVESQETFIFKPATLSESITFAICDGDA